MGCMINKERCKISKKKNRLLGHHRIMTIDLGKVVLLSLLRVVKLEDWVDHIFYPLERQISKTPRILAFEFE